MTDQEKQNNEECGEDKYLIVEYQEVQNTRRAHGTDFFKAITWSAIAVFLFYKLIIDANLPPLCLCPIAVVGIWLTYVICKRHLQRLDGHDTRISQLEKHFKFKSQVCYKKHVPSRECNIIDLLNGRLGVTKTLGFLLMALHFMVFIYGFLIFVDVVPDYRDATNEITDQKTSDKRD